MFSVLLNMLYFIRVEMIIVVMVIPGSVYIYRAAHDFGSLLYQHGTIYSYLNILMFLRTNRVRGPYSTVTIATRTMFAQCESSSSKEGVRD